MTSPSEADVGSKEETVVFLPVSRSEVGLGVVEKQQQQYVPPMVAEDAAAGGRSVRVGGLEKRKEGN